MKRRLVIKLLSLSIKRSCILCQKGPKSKIFSLGTMDEGKLNHIIHIKIL